MNAVRTRETGPAGVPSKTSTAPAVRPLASASTVASVGLPVLGDGAGGVGASGRKGQRLLSPSLHRAARPDRAAAH